MYLLVKLSRRVAKANGAVMSSRAAIIDCRNCCDKNRYSYRSEVFDEVMQLERFFSRMSCGWPSQDGRSRNDIDHMGYFSNVCAVGEAPQTIVMPLV